MTANLKEPHNHHECIQRALQRATTICAEQGLRFTALRRRVLELVWQAHKPVGAYDILGQLSTDGHQAAPPTVYRALDFLLDSGLVHRIASLNAFVGCSEPGHGNFGQFLICSKCAAVTEMRDANVIESVIHSAANNGFLVQGQIIEAVGLCSNCSH